MEDPHFVLPIYTKTQAAALLRVPETTFRNWAVGYVLKRVGAPPVIGDAIVTTADAPTPRGPSVPFVGLAEAHTLAAFRAAGLPLQRIRPAISWLQTHIGLQQALASERLMTDGAEVLWDFGRSSGAEGREVADELVVLRSGQQVFRPVVRDYLRRVTYKDGWVRTIRLQGYRAAVVIDPFINGGAPTLARRGVRVSDVIGRIRAGEEVAAVARDYRIGHGDIHDLIDRQAA